MCYNNISYFKGNYFQEQHRSSHRRCSVIKDVLRNFAKFTAKHLCQSLFFNKVAGVWFTARSSHRRCSGKKKVFLKEPKACNFIKKRLWHRRFPVNFAKFLRTPLLQNTSRWLLLHADKILQSTTKWSFSYLEISVIITTIK